jgi:soluble cytochrome b562
MTTRILAAALLLWLAQQPAPAPATPPTTVPAGPQPKPVIPIATAALSARPELYAGSTVSLTAAVARVYAGTAFSIVQANQKDGAADILVVTPLLTAPLAPGSYVTIIGEVIRFDTANLAARLKDAAPALPADVVDRYRGKPAIVAVSIINAAMTDLAKRLPPPMSADELRLNKAMKQVGPAFAELRQAATAADAAAQAAALEAAFTDAAAFWKTQPHADAIQWTADARALTAEIAAAAGKGNLDAVKTAVPKLQQICGNCHTAHRERLDDGTYRYKQAVK